jgi:hypothetical protein
MREDVLLLLRLWRNEAGSGSWRASLEDLRSKQFVRFSSIETLLRYIQTQEWNPRIGLQEPQRPKEGVFGPRAR